MRLGFLFLFGFYRARCTKSRYERSTREKYTMCSGYPLPMDRMDGQAVFSHPRNPHYCRRATIYFLAFSINLFPKRPASVHMFAWPLDPSDCPYSHQRRRTNYENEDGGRMTDWTAWRRRIRQSFDGGDGAASATRPQSSSCT